MDSILKAKNGAYKCTECKQLKDQFNLTFKVPEIELRDGKIVGNPDEGHFCRPGFTNYPGTLMAQKI
uniref:Uncharacterized protein n=1 Tax=Acrobeloides nanus TaxID=290746 RepID=A0A914EJD1_9BILA